MITCSVGGVFGITNAIDVSEKGMAVAIMGGGDDSYLFRRTVSSDSEVESDEVGEGEVVIDGETTAIISNHKFVYIVDMKHMRRHATNLDDVEQVAGLRGWRFVDSDIGS